MPIARPYTVRFVRASVGGQLVRFTVPQGFRAVVRNVDAVNVTSNPNFVGLSVGGYYLVYKTLQAGENLHVDSRFVGYAGDYLEAQVQTAGATLVCTGFLFEDPVGPP